MVDLFFEYLKWVVVAPGLFIAAGAFFTFGAVITLDMLGIRMFNLHQTITIVDGRSPKLRSRHDA